MAKELVEMNVQPQQLGLSFEDDVLGDAQEFSFYNRDKGIWLLPLLDKSLF